MPETSPATQPQSSSRSRRFLTRRRFLQLGGGSALGLAVYSGEIARHEIDVVHRTLALPGLPEAMSGFRIVQISDIHYEEFTEPFFVREVVRRVNALQPDLVALTGDYISEGPLPHRYALRWSGPCAEILSGIRCPLRYAVLGNHDATVSAPAVTEALESHGIPVLADRAVAVERNGGRIWLAGVKDALLGKPDLEAALPATAAADREPVILLVHEPDYADHVVRTAASRVSLILSGHTHGGQVRIPFLPPVYLPQMGTEYIEGYFRFGPVQLYVNRGIGTVGVPFRFLCPPEITVFTLTRA